MRSLIIFLAFLLLPSFAGAQTSTTNSSHSPGKQTPTPATSNQQKDADKAPAKESPVIPATTVGESEVIITIPGVCQANGAATDCSTKITRADFESLINAVNPNTPMDARRGIAVNYSQALAMATEAKKRGIDKDPLVQAQMLGLLAQSLQRKLMETSKPSQAEIESYYTENSSKFEELSLRRIVVLKSANPELKPDQLKDLAERIRTRAAAGEDPDKLQVEAFKAAKSTGVPPSTDLGWKRRGGMDPRHEPQIMQLHAGEISPVLEDVQAYYIYKVDSKRLVPLASVQKDVENTLQVQHAQKTLHEIVDGSKPQLNEAYFGPAPAPPAPMPTLQTPPPK